VGNFRQYKLIEARDFFSNESALALSLRRVLWILINELVDGVDTAAHTRDRYELSILP